MLKINNDRHAPEDLIIKRGGWGPINRFNAASFLCLSQVRTWISNIIYCGLLL